VDLPAPRCVTRGVTSPRVRPVAFFVVTYVVTGLLWLPAIRSGQPLAVVMQGPSTLLVLLATVTPSLVAIILAGIEGGRHGIGELLGQGVRWRFGLGWYGYALPRLQRRMRPLPASLLIGILWAAWHLPYYAFPEVHPQPFAIDFSLFAVVLVSHSVMMTWVYNSTRGSVLATMPYHHSIHLASLIPVVPGVAGGLVFALVHIAAATAAGFAGGGSLVGVRGTRSVTPWSPRSSKHSGKTDRGGGLTGATFLVHDSDRSHLRVPSHNPTGTIKCNSRLSAADKACYSKNPAYMSYARKP